LTALLSLAGALLCAQTPAPSGGKLDFVAGDESSGGFRPLPEVALTVVGPNDRTYSGVTGQDAHFRLSDLPPGVYSIRDIQAKGYGPNALAYPGVSFIPAGTTWVVNVPMLRLATVEGIVTGDDGKPLAGATVYLQFYRAPPLKRPDLVDIRDIPTIAQADAERQWELKGTAATTQTDTQGRYRFEGNFAPFIQSGYMPTDRFGVAAGYPGDDFASAYTSFFVEFRSGKTSFAELRLSAAQKTQ
jgi:hypothetical protein